MSFEQHAGAAVIEPDYAAEGQTAVAERKKPKRQPRYHVLLWDDQHHSHAYVIGMLQKLFGYPVEKGFKLAQEVHQRGRAIVLTTTREHAELKRDQIHAFGKEGMVAECQGSMSSSIEPEI